MHVHDLVDYVSEEAEIAGRAAAEYLNRKPTNAVHIPVTCDGKVRYTVPQRITAPKDVTVYFRVADEYRNVTLHVSDGTREVLTKKKIKMAPGEMETVTLKADALKNVSSLHFSLEVSP